LSVHFTSKITFITPCRLVGFQRCFRGTYEYLLPISSTLKMKVLYFSSTWNCHKCWQLTRDWNKKEQKYTYEVKLRCVRVIVVAVENNKYDIFWVCLFSLRYAGCNAHMPYSHVWPAQHYNVFDIITLKARFLEKSFWTHMCIDFIYNVCLKRFSF
jgi:hypothetical protein